MLARSSRTVSIRNRTTQSLQKTQTQRFSGSRSLFEQKLKTETTTETKTETKPESSTTQGTEKSPASTYSKNVLPQHDEETLKEMIEAKGETYNYDEVQATGIDRAERQFGSDALFPDEYVRLLDPEDQFVMIPTFEAERSVGCAGLCDEGVPAGYRFWSMKPGQKATCTLCGRRFYCYNPEHEYEKQVKLEQELEEKGISMERYHLMKLTEERRQFEDICKKHNIQVPNPEKQLPDIENFSEEEVKTTLKDIYDVQDSELENIVKDTAVLLEKFGEEDEDHLLVQ
eukprot:gb/GECH01011692.1/.p1 GENE.gb/GECH01011692.1/~~gb/GECH01011692.1/.p1  ORF type:complete len:286 (+),score=92.47 gb/GECH01011692.1/:1-858(+)